MASAVHHQLDSGERNAVCPEGRPGERAHCRRVAALALELARILELPPEAQAVVEQAALRHHEVAPFLDPRTVARLMRVIAGESWEAWILPDQQPDPVREVLRALPYPPGARERTPTTVLAELVSLANLFDENLQALQYEDLCVQDILEDLVFMSYEPLYLPEVTLALRRLPRAGREELLGVLDRLPVFPKVALRVLKGEAEAKDEFGLLNELASSDPVLAGSLLRVANSPLYSPARNISRIAQAISYIGPKAARKVLTAAVFRPYFMSSRLMEIWKHSVLSAHLAERLALTSGKVDPKEAFLAGLVHDIGHLAMQRLPAPVVEAQARLVERGCDPMFVEKLLCWCDHAELGARVLERWHFPEPLVAAVRHHHQPEKSQSMLAAILYLAEDLSRSREDLPSHSRFWTSLDRTGIPFELLEQPEPSSSLLNTLMGAA